MITSIRAYLAFFAVAFAMGTSVAATGGNIAIKAIEAALEKAEQVSGRKVGGTAARKVAIAEVERLAKTHGDSVLKLVEDSGLELLEAVPKHGDDLVRIAMDASPQARRALALNVDELLPLTQRVGVDALELEAKVAGQSSHAFQLFGDEGGKLLSKSVPTQDIPRLISFGEKADSGATRKLLLETYQKDGQKLFQRIPPEVMLGGVLTVPMIVLAHDAGAESRAKGEVLRDNPEIAKDVMNRSTLVYGGVTLLVIILLLWRYGLMPWHRTKSKPD